MALSTLGFFRTVVLSASLFVLLPQHGGIAGVTASVEYEYSGSPTSVRVLSQARALEISTDCSPGDYLEKIGRASCRERV